MDILRDHCDDVSIETFTASLDELANSIAHHISQNGKVNHTLMWYIDRRKVL